MLEGASAAVLTAACRHLSTRMHFIECKAFFIYRMDALGRRVSSVLRRCISFSLILLFLLALTVTGLRAQQRRLSLQWEWGDPAQPFRADSLYSRYRFTGAMSAYPGAPIYHVHTFVVEGAVGDLYPVVVDAEYRGVPLAVERLPLWVNNYDEATARLERARGEYRVMVCLPAFRVNGAALEYLTSYRVVLSKKSGTGTRSESETRSGRTRSYTGVPHSVLSSGKWYQVSIADPGVYRIDYEELEHLGFDDIGNLSVWGGDGGPLSFSNSDSYPDDLSPMPVLWVHPDERSLPAPGSFALVYLPGPHAWHWSDTERMYRYAHNLFETRAYYFLTTSSTLRPTRAVRIESPGGSAAHGVDSYWGLSAFVGDREQLARSGWELFSTPLSFSGVQSISSGITDAVPGSRARVYARLAASSSAPSRFTIEYGGQSVGEVGIGGIAPLVSKVELARVEEGFFDVDGVTGGAFDVLLEYSRPQASSRSWISRLTFNVRRYLTYEAGSRKTLLIPTDALGGGGLKLQVGAEDVSRLWVWNVSDPHATAHHGSADRHAPLPSIERGWAAIFDPLSTPHPRFEGPVPNQDLHGINEIPDLLIVTAPLFLSQAEGVAEVYRRSPLRPLRVSVATTEEIYREFASGSCDPSAIRNYVRMLYWRGGGASGPLKYLLLIGKPSTRYLDPAAKERAPWYLPNYQSRNSWDEGDSYGTDDYYGLLDPGEGGGEGLLDIAVGRYSVRTRELAERIVNREREYHSPASWGPWMARAAFVADDADANGYMIGSDSLARYVERNRPAMVAHRLYADAFEQDSYWFREAYPNVSRALTAYVNRGLFLFNYIGHGSLVQLANENILNAEDTYQWNNSFRRPIFMAASCNFAQYDVEELYLLPGRKSAYPEYSLAERLVFQPSGGAIAAVASSRISYSYSNFDFNFRCLESIYSPSYPGGNATTLGEAIRYGKIRTAALSNKRKYLLLGNPALPLLDPSDHVDVTHLGNHPVIPKQDTLRAGQIVDLQLSVTTASGAPFSGPVHVLVRGPYERVHTLNNDSHAPFEYQERSSVAFRGTATAREGVAKIRFPLPLDMDVDYGFAIVNLLGVSSATVAQGAYEGFVIGGRAHHLNTQDQQGPQIALSIEGKAVAPGNDPASVPQSFNLQMDLADPSGINVTGRRSEHNLQITFRHRESGELVRMTLNDFYRAVPDDYTRGSVHYRVAHLAPGDHDAEVIAYDALNNASRVSFAIRVREDLPQAIVRAVNHPNPFTDGTSFYLQTDRPGVESTVRIEIYTVDGQLVRMLTYREFSPGRDLGPYYWNGRDDFNQRLARGVYFYRIAVRNHSGYHANSLESYYWGKLLKL